MDVLITVDTELSSGGGETTAGAVRENMRRAIYGVTAKGEFGLRHQLEVLNRHGLKAVFFVEALFASACGIEPLAEIVATVEQAGHEVQLHLHTEWLAHMANNPLGRKTGTYLHQFDRAEQTALLAAGLDNLKRAGARGVCAFRAGNYGADFDTLSALAELGLSHDTSYNFTYLGNGCAMPTEQPMLAPEKRNGIWEVPITFFEDWPGHYRHTQLGACSHGELSSMLDQAAATGRSSFVVVSHSFELLNAARTGPNRIVVARFERLCKYLADNADRYRTAGFADLNGDIETDGQREPGMLRSNALRTARRTVEQIGGRIYG